MTRDSGAERPVTVIRGQVGASVRDVQRLLRTLAEVRDTVTDGQRTPRSWAWFGELGVDDGLTENERVVEHDRVGRLAVRLAVDKCLCIGESRAVRALHQGAVMEGSWGDEVRLVESVDAARTAVIEGPGWRPESGDVILVAAVSPDVAALIDDVMADLGLPVREHLQPGASEGEPGVEDGNMKAGTGETGTGETGTGQ